MARGVVLVSNYGFPRAAQPTDFKILLTLVSRDYYLLTFCIYIYIVMPCLFGGVRRLDCLRSHAVSFNVEFFSGVCYSIHFAILAAFSCITFNLLNHVKPDEKHRFRSMTGTCGVCSSCRSLGEDSMQIWLQVLPEAEHSPLVSTGDTFPQIEWPGTKDTSQGRAGKTRGLQLETSYKA